MTELRGHLDAVTACGEIEGWAYDVDRPAGVVEVAVLNGDGREVAAGFAHRYRPDLVEAGCGVGWCHFSLVTEGHVAGSFPLTLISRKSGQVLFAAENLPVLKRPPQADTWLHALDPTAAHHVRELRGCDVVFEAFIRARGLDDFVRSAFLYLLARPAHPDELELFARILADRALRPSVFLEVLAATAEFRALSPRLAAPNMADFPLKI